jgi:hypothetical protein
VHVDPPGVGPPDATVRDFLDPLADDHDRAVGKHLPLLNVEQRAVFEDDRAHESFNGRCAGASVAAR